MSPSDTRALFATEDGKHYAYPSGEGSRQQVVVDGFAGPVYTQAATQQISQFSYRNDPNTPERPPSYIPNRMNIAFKRGGAEAVYVGQKQGNAHVVVAKEGVHEEWPSLGQLQLAAISPGGVFAYALFQERVGREYVTHMIVDGKQMPGTPYIGAQPTEHAFHEPENGPAHFAYVGRNNRTVEGRMSQFFQVYVDGIPGPEFQTINVRQMPLSFVEIDGKLAVFYLVRKSQESGERVVFQYLDGTTYQSEMGVDVSSVRMNPAKTAVAWLQGPVANANPRISHNTAPTPVPIKVFINGEESFTIDAEPNEVRSLGYSFRLSPDGSRWAIERTIQGGNGTAKFMLVDGLRGPEYSMIERSNFTPGSQRHYFVARNGRSGFVVIDGAEYGPFNRINYLVSSDSGQTIAWHANTDTGGTIYLNGSPATFVDTSVSQFPLTFKPGTEDYIALAGEPEGPFLHIGDEKYSANSRQTSFPTFSPDGSRFAISGEFSTGPGQPGSQYLIDGEPLLTIDENIRVDGQAWKGFSPNNKHFITFANTLEQTEIQNRQAGTVLVDGYELGPLFYDTSRDARAPHFREDGRFSFYCIYDRQIRRVSIDLDAAAEFGKERLAAAQKSGGTTIFTVDPELKLTSIGTTTVRDGNVIYGVAQGGEYGAGALYRVNSDGTDFQVLHTFLGGGEHAQLPSSIVLGDDGYLYGMTGQNSFFMKRPQVAGALFRIRTDGNGYEIVKFYEYSNKFRSSPILEGLAPDGSLLARGPVPNPGNSGTDGLLKIDRQTGEISVIYRASYYPEDGQPVFKTLVPFEDGQDGYYYGYDQRTLYRFQLDGNAPTPIHEFKGSPLDGDAVGEAPIFHGDWLYGITRGGGKNRLGTVYRLKRDGTDYEVLIHQERDQRFVALTAGPAGVWGYRNGQAIVGNRQSRVPFLERLDVLGGEPRILKKTRLSDNLWIEDFEGEPTLFSLSGTEISVVSMDPSATTPPELTTETIPAPPLKDAVLR
ncbi:choice-of-anchor tandem repeat GloVer-containing protein [Pelagicoccus sp. SDUM812002]|uniref:choice-of-anchor tandem repeat GloVer-containing protein n=1 Tax=Pelagicoccus sp. SDUM812002 TaxID=3041266 RepID=UPI00280DB06F|nr:choice-of-anchor tandem repeat GloVer-containing protein [Pelagicoccus sp. SDUM812002]MDQ8186722.1 hypothetical protein [Pelagicoccus sp. SDUM812002]